MRDDFWRIAAELANIEDEADSLTSSMPRVTDSLLNGPIRFLIIEGMASSVEKVYTGVPSPGTEHLWRWA